MSSNLSHLNHKLYYILLLIVAILIPTAEPLPVKLSSFSVILLTFWWLVSGNYKEKLYKLRQNKLLWLFAALFLINLLGLAKTDNPGAASGLLVRKLPLLLMPIIIGTSFTLTRKQLNYLLLSFIVSLFAVSLFTFREGIAVLLDREDLTTMVNLTLIHRPYFGMLCIFAIVGLIYLILQTPLTQVKVIIAVSILYFIFFIYILYAKMTVITIIALLFMYATIVLVRKVGAPVILIGGIILAASAFQFIRTNEESKVVIDKIINFEDFSYQEYNIHLVSSINIRFINWGCSIKALKQDNNWLTGLGIGNTQPELNECYKNSNPWIYEQAMNSHSEYLEEGMRNGLLGLFILVACLSIPAGLSIRSNNLFYLSFIVIFAICSLTESMLSRQVGIMFYAFFNSILAFNTLGLKPQKQI